MGVTGFLDLKRHIGHQIEVVGYGSRNPETQEIDEIFNVAIECLNCGEVLLDFDDYELWGDCQICHSERVCREGKPCPEQICECCGLPKKDLDMEG